MNLIHNNNIDVEFILLDYNSDDGLGQFIQENFEKHINSGALVYYRTDGPEYFNRSHSRNLAFKLASGRLVCNLDADNYTGEGFADFLIEQFESNENIFTSASDLNRVTCSKDLLGRICMRKSDFERVGGFDERMISYGFEDYDIINRLGLLGLKNKVMNNEGFMQAIEHTDTERISKEKDINLFQYAYVKTINYMQCRVLIVFKNNKAKIATMQNNRAVNSTEVENFFYNGFDFSILEEMFQEVNYNTSGNTLEIQIDVNEVLSIEISQDKKSKNNFCKVENKEMIDNILMFYTQINNRNIMERNKREGNINVNKNGYGQDKLHRNFDTTSLIYIN